MPSSAKTFIAKFRVTAAQVKLILPLLEGEAELLSLEAETSAQLTNPSSEPPRRRTYVKPPRKRDGLNGAVALALFLADRPVGSQFEGTRAGKFLETKGFDYNTASSLLTKAVAAGTVRRVERGLYEVVRKEATL